jgi:hypothetical protein
MLADCESWPITVTLVAVSGKGECREYKPGRRSGQPNAHEKSLVIGQSKRLPDR